MKFSVLISVYQNDDPALFHLALQSIFYDQTLKPNQIVLVQDGPLPHTLSDIIAQWQKKLQSTLTLVKLEKNSGLGAALNAGLAECQHDWVARMDSDDISLPQRFARQVEFAQKNQNIDVFSAFLEEIDESGQTQFIRKLPLQHHDILRFAKSRSPINHPLAFFRKKAILSVGGYPHLKKSQDYGLWSILLTHGFQFANIPEVLLRMQCGRGLLQRRGWEYFKNDFQVLQLQRKCHFISNFLFLKNTVSRLILRLAPHQLKISMYKNLRG